MSNDPVTAVADAAGAVIKEVTQHEALKNTPEMIDAATKQREQEAVDKTNAAIKNGDVGELRKEVSG